MLTGLLLSLAILSGLARANSRYFYCDAMGLLDTDPCAAPAAQTGLSSGQGNEPAEGIGASTELRQSHTDCCEVLTLPPMPASTTVDVPAVPPPTLASIQPAAPVLDVRALAAHASSDRAFERWRPPPASARELRAQLMVFLT